jgi:murein DD-endopeptidase MepM/ murein hydrolase activator NlpD
MAPKTVLVCTLFAFVLFESNCVRSAKDKKENSTEKIVESIPVKEIKIDSSKIAFGFDFPVGKPDGKGYYDYQGFTKNNHLGEDWNGIRGSNTDLGDTIYSIGNGQVTFAEDIGGGWGNTIRIVHELPDGRKYESVYAHCDTIISRANSWTLKGEPIGTIGTGNGQYLAHLHLEIREEIGLAVGNGYSADTTGYVNPTAFIKKHRQIPASIDSIKVRKH